MKGIESWSHPTWVMFHTLAAKVKPDHFLKARKKLFWIIKNICYTLPCPDCRKHAITFMKSIHFKNIKTKDAFIYVLFVFHNNVNKRLNKPLFTQKQLEDKYNSINLKNITNKFIKAYRLTNKNNRDMANSIARNILLRDINTWLAKNNNYFI
jgi:hypothetical protein